MYQVDEEKFWQFGKLLAVKICHPTVHFCVNPKNTNKMSRTKIIKRPHDLVTLRHVHSLIGLNSSWNRTYGFWSHTKDLRDCLTSYQNNYETARSRTKLITRPQDLVTLRRVHSQAGLNSYWIRPQDFSSHSTKVQIAWPRTRIIKRPHDLVQK